MFASTFDQLLTRCAQACEDCAGACQRCANECAMESDIVDLTRCMRVDLDCADVCRTTGRYLSRSGINNPGLLTVLLQGCVEACAECADECDLHNHHECSECAEACRGCAIRCRGLLRELRHSRQNRPVVSLAVGSALCG